MPEAPPKIPVHPNPEYKKGGFECIVAPLSMLLEYRQEDNKESIFEVGYYDVWPSHCRKMSRALVKRRENGYVNLWDFTSIPLKVMNICKV